MATLRLSEQTGLSNWGCCSLSEGSVPRPFDDSIGSSIQGFGQVSPDGHWLTYAVSETGQGWDIYVQSFPMPGRGKWRVSRDWGASPRWSRDGREIFYYAKDGRLMAVPVISRGPGLAFGRAAPLFEAALSAAQLRRSRSNSSTTSRAMGDSCSTCPSNM